MLLVRIFVLGDVRCSINIAITNLKITWPMIEFVRFYEFYLIIDETVAEGSTRPNIARKSTVPTRGSADGSHHYKPHAAPLPSGVRVCFVAVVHSDDRRILPGKSSSLCFTVICDTQVYSNVVTSTRRQKFRWMLPSKHGTTASTDMI